MFETILLALCPSNFGDIAKTYLSRTAGIGVGAAATATAVSLGFALNSKDGVGSGPAYNLFGSLKHYTAASFGTSGILFKDTLEVNAFEDPKVEGITIYVSRVKRPMVDKVRHGLFQVCHRSSRI